MRAVTFVDAFAFFDRRAAAAAAAARGGGGAMSAGVAYFSTLGLSRFST